MGRLADASNLALLCEVAVAGRLRRCVYKPASGERSLWDFPGVVLGRREVLVAQVAAVLGWDLLPATVWRAGGPAGPGMCQEWVEDCGPAAVGLFEEAAVPPGWPVVAEGRTADDRLVVLAHEDSPALRRIAVLDDLVNNADRKGGHVLRREDGRLAGIDHGVSFHAEPKLRTVLWGWAGEPIDPVLLDELRSGEAGFAALIAAAPLDGDERAAASGRLRRLLDEGRYAVPGDGWPTLPWPPI